MQYWLVKSEPNAYSWNDLIEEKVGVWDGVRNYQARNNLKAMKVDDQVLFYHSVSDREVVGITKVVKEFYQDPTTDDERWVVVDLVPVRELKKPVGLKLMKADARLENMSLIKQSRLSVCPLTKEEFDVVLELSERE